MSCIVVGLIWILKYGYDIFLSAKEYEIKEEIEDLTIFVFLCIFVLTTKFVMEAFKESRVFLRCWTAERILLQDPAIAGTFYNFYMESSAEVDYVLVATLIQKTWNPIRIIQRPPNERISSIARWRKDYNLLMRRKYYQKQMMDSNSDINIVVRFCEQVQIFTYKNEAQIDLELYYDSLLSEYSNTESLKSTQKSLSSMESNILIVNDDVANYPENIYASPNEETLLFDECNILQNACENYSSTNTRSSQISQLFYNFRNLFKLKANQYHLSYPQIPIPPPPPQMAHQKMPFFIMKKNSNYVEMNQLSGLEINELIKNRYYTLTSSSFSVL